MTTMQGKTRAVLAALALAAAGMAAATGAPMGTAAAQTIDLATGGGAGAGNGAPIEVVADDGIEWLQTDKKFIARGNAVATRGTTQVFADTLVADYRELPEDRGGGTEVYRLTAEGNVTIKSPQETATGSRAIYNVDDALLTLWGGPATLVTPTDTVTAQDQIRYYERDRKAVASGDAVAVRGERRIAADTLTAFFVDPEGGKAKPAAKPAGGDSLAGDSELDRIYADGNVVITTPKETIESAQGNYNAKTGIAEMEGSVKITQGKSVLQGERATSNLNTHVSTLHSGSGGMARGLLVPKNAEGASN